MLCDCVYAEKNNGMDKGMQLANQIEELTLDYSTSSLVWSTEKMALNEKLGDHQRPPRKQYNYKNCSCFKIKHIHDLCELCVRSCRWRAREAYEERKEEEREERRRLREEKVFAERLEKVSEERKEVVAKWMGGEMECSTTYINWVGGEMEQSTKYTYNTYTYA